MSKARRQPYWLLEALIPTPEDRALAEQLVSEGWVQTSSKYRHIRRWKTPPPRANELIRPEHQTSYFGKLLAEEYSFVVSDLGLRCAPTDMVEERTLSIGQFKAYKELLNRPFAKRGEKEREESHG